MRPATGGRVICNLASSDELGALYTVAIYTPDNLWMGQAQIRASDGHVDLGAWDAVDVPAWLIDYTQAFFRSEWKAHSRTPGVPWSYRISRWRAQRD